MVAISKGFERLKGGSGGRGEGRRGGGGEYFR